MLRLFPRYVFVRLPTLLPPFGVIRACDGVQSFLGIQGRTVVVPSRRVEWLEIAEVIGACDKLQPLDFRAETFAVGDAVTCQMSERVELLAPMVGCGTKKAQTGARMALDEEIPWLSRAGRPSQRRDL